MLARCALCITIAISSAYFIGTWQDQKAVQNDIEFKQLETSVLPEIKQAHRERAMVSISAAIATLLLCVFIMWGDIKNMARYLAAMLLVCVSVGCNRPFEPVKLDVVAPNEEGFLLPYTADLKAQSSTHTEEYLKANLVHTKQVKIPQQWVQKGFETTGANGDWKDAAVLVKVDKSPVTREWTADPNTGTSNKNEAIWVMTSDQVEFSTGWTCTARIENRDDAVKFLYNYPNSGLEKIMDRELRGKLQAVFGLEVTDLPMIELRVKATPHINKVTKELTDFFKLKGVTITNLGITGGFVYRDPSVVKKLVEVFNAEQEKNIAVAKANAQLEKNKQIQMEADAKAKAIYTEKEGEAKAIKLVADAKAYEVEKAKQDPEFYLTLRRLELEKVKTEKWDGSFPTYFMGSENGGLNMLLQAPNVREKATKK